MQLRRPSLCSHKVQRSAKQKIGYRVNLPFGGERNANIGQGFQHNAFEPRNRQKCATRGCSVEFVQHQRYPDYWRSVART